MQAKLINTLADLLNVDLAQYEYMTPSEQLAMLEELQLAEVLAV